MWLIKRRFLVMDSMHDCICIFCSGNVLLFQVVAFRFLTPGFTL
jgi:hypothetical protein